MTSLQHRRKAFRAVGGAAIFVFQDFTATTTGDLSITNPSTDEVGNGWIGNDTVFDFQGDSTGVQCTSGASNQAVSVETSGREDVEVTQEFVISRGTGNGRWNSMMVRGHTSAHTDSLKIIFDGIASDPNLLINDEGSLIKTWDLSVLMSTPPIDTDTVILVMKCSGNDITLYSMEVNGGGAEVIDDTFTLTGGAATNHGAGSGADWYGMHSHERVASSGERFANFEVKELV